MTKNLEPDDKGKIMKIERGTTLINSRNSTCMVFGFLENRTIVIVSDWGDLSGDLVLRTVSSFRNSGPKINVEGKAYPNCIGIDWY